VKAVIVAYIPVLHQGYINFLNSHVQNADQIYLFTSDQIKQFRSVVKDIRALEPEVMLEVLSAVFPELKTKLLSPDEITAIKDNKVQIITPEDEVFEPLVRELFPDNSIITDPVFLRWDKKRSISRTDVSPDQTTSSTDFDRQMIDLANSVAQLSSDWWRQVAGALVGADGKLLLTGRNRHLPHDYQHYSDGDPRADFQSGENIETTSSIHAEAQIIANAAKQGISTEGCSLFVTTFPCPVCAKLIATSGIKKIYYQDGYALLDGESVLKQAGIEIIRVV
jgi:dCMP deaminase